MGTEEGLRLMYKAKQIRGRWERIAPVKPEQLSDTQREVAKRLAESETTGIIAERMHLALKTVEYHRTRLMRRLGLGGVNCGAAIALLTRWAAKHGLIEVEVA